MAYHPSDPSVAEMLADVLTAARVGADSGGIDLDAWEEEFTQSLGQRLAFADDLTVKQLEKLRAIWDRI